MSAQTRKRFQPDLFASALARLAGAYLGLLALAVTYLIGLLYEVSHPTALLRAAVTALVFAGLGRGLGWVTGRSLARTLQRERLAHRVEAGAGS